MKSRFSATNKAQRGDWHKVCTTFTPGVALKLTPPKPEKSAEEPETAGEWTPLTPRVREGRGATPKLTPPRTTNYMEEPGTAGEGTPLATEGRAEREVARKLTPPTTNSGAGLGTEGA
ncbi:hypothetical protein E2C01_025523 [Portunus trituberculatus]|uniref:Uncharacterized protein n=1 Tax=Portunus trituberculatus TaxID=210409 RepID=A0A5B7EG55_PORTR|nr:hypothetical protein [Portunus trituberculatus]